MPAVQSAGRLVGLGRAPQRTTPRAMDVGGLRSTYAQIFEKQPAVRTVIGFGARNIAQLGLHAFTRTADDDRRRLRTEPLARLVRRPNPRLTTFSWIFGIAADLMIFDVHYAAKAQAPDGTRWLVPIIPEMVQPIGDSWLWPDAYQVGGSNGLTFTPEQMFVVHGYHPGSRWLGCSPMEALRRILAGDQAAEDYRSQFWSNGAQISGVLKRPVSAPAWSDTAKTKFLDQWQSRYGPYGSAAGGTPLLEDDMDYTPIGGNAKEAQYVESRKLTREEVAAVYGYPPPLVGIMDAANYSNVKEYRSMLYQDVLGPTLVQLEQEFWLQLVTDVGNPDTDYVEFNVMEKLRGTFEEQAAIFSTAVGGPFMLRAEARSRLNLPHVDGTDELIVPLNVLEGGQASPRDTAPPKALTGAKAARPKRIRATTTAEHVDTIDTALRGSFARQLHAVRTALGSGKAAKATVAEVWNRKRWDRELAADLLDASTAVATAVAGTVHQAAGDDPATADAQPMRAWLRAKAEATAVELNDTTAELLAAALDDDAPAAAVTTVLDPDGGRAGVLAGTFAAAVAGFAFVDTARATGYGAKQWIVTAGKSRHPELDGETVPIDDVFSNGARWPGDSAAGADQAAGCTCELVITPQE